jgi:hypothetical protein
MDPDFPSGSFFIVWFPSTLLSYLPGAVIHSPPQFPIFSNAIPDTMQIVEGVVFFLNKNCQDVALFLTNSGGMIGFARKISKNSHRNEGILK